MRHKDNIYSLGICHSLQIFKHLGFYLEKEIIAHEFYYKSQSIVNFTTTQTQISLFLTLTHGQPQ